MAQATTDEGVFQTLADKGRHSWWRYLLTVLLAFLVQGLILLAAAAALVATGFPSDKLAKAVQDPAQPLLFFSCIGVSFAGLLLGFVLGGAWLHRKSFSDYVGPAKFGGFLLGLSVWLVVLLGDSAIGYLVRPAAFSLGSLAFNPAVLGAILGGLAIQTFAEEFIFRGYVTQGLLKAFRRPLPTALVSGLIFGAMHIPNGLPQAVSAAIVGVGLALVAIRTGSLAIGYGAHLINNVFSAVVVVSGGDVFRGSPGLIMENAPDLVWLDVGVETVAIALILAALYRRRPVRPALAQA
jgi:membrane protease YdiL (CAAX protease family)